jgi:hypothetical protein
MEPLAIAAAASGAIPDAIPDIVGRAIRSGEWKEEGGKLVRHAEGFPERGMDGKPITPESVMPAIRKDVPSTGRWKFVTQSAIGRM